MHYTTHALLNCVALFFLCYGNAARLSSKEGLSHFARTISSALEPILANELQTSRLNHSSTRGDGLTTITRRQIDPRPPLSLPNQEQSNDGRAIPGNQPFLNQGYPFQYERTQQFHYPPYSQQLTQNFYPGGGAAFNNQPLPNGLPIDPRFFQQPIRNRPLEPVQPENPKALNANANANNNDIDKNNKNNNVNTIQNLDTNVDSKSSAQNRPFDGPDFPNQAGFNNQDPGLGNLRVDNRFSAIDYERIRQNYYSDPPINQQRNYYSSSFNDIPFNGGPPYRSSIGGGRYPGLYYNGGDSGRPGISPSELRSNGGIDGIDNSYFNGFLQGPYRSFGYNSLAGNIGGGGGGGGAGGVGGGGGAGIPFSDNFGLPFNGPQYSAGFGGPFYNGGGVGGPNGPGNFPFNAGGDSSLRASASKETLAGVVTPRETSSQRPKQQKNTLRDDKNKSSSNRVVGKERKDQT